MPTIISRSQWGARYADGYDNAPVPAPHLILHHSATNASGDAEDAQMRILERIGQERFGSGMSYTFAVFPSGQIYQGVSIDRASAHTLKHNYDARAIVMVGNYQTARPSLQMMESIHLLAQTGNARGWWLPNRIEGGHRDFEVPGYTECPGDAGERSIALINSLTPGDDMPLTPQEVDAIWNDPAAWPDDVRDVPHNANSYPMREWVIGANIAAARNRITLTRMESEMAILHEQITGIVDKLNGE